LKVAGRVDGIVTAEDGSELQSTNAVLVRVNPETMARLAEYNGFFTRQTGLYSAYWLPAGYYVVEVTSSGQSWYPNLGGAASIAEATPFYVDWGQTVEHPAIVLDRTPHVGGYVEFVQPGPTIYDAYTSVVATPLNPSLGTRSASLPRSGSYVIDGLVAGEQYRICVRERSPLNDAYRFVFETTCVGQDAQNPDGAPIVATADGDRDLDITVTASQAVVVWTVYAEGPSGEILVPTTVGARYWRLDESTGRWVLEGDSRGATSNYGRGTANSPFLPPGRYRIEVFYTIEGKDYKEYYPAGTTEFADAEIVDVEPGVVTWLQPGMIVDLRPTGFSRISGDDRFATAVALSKKAFPEEPWMPDTVYIANGLNFPDALAAGPAAAAAGAPILLVTPTAIPQVVKDELERLQPDTIVVAGGLASVSAQVEAELAGYVTSGESADVRRLAGVDRYDTSRVIVADAFSDLDTRPVVFVATGANYPDALAAGAAAGYFGGPVVLLDGARSTIDDPTLALLDDLHPQAIVVAGGTGSVSAAIVSRLTSRYQGPDTPVVRLWGGSRYDTAVAINGLIPDADSAYLAGGEGFADALASGPVAALTGSPLYLAPPTCIPWFVLDDIEAILARDVFVVGGTGVLSPRVLEGRVC
ncbi:MAG: cell wall-binding repeat-containing protein, partial [Rhodoglobus sp.]|nr:cell wall-binding repeat-containing protein [Rhodoglobus sp.]